MPVRNPQTPGEWREAVALAEACLQLDSARLYGLVTGGPAVDAERCVEVLRRGKARGIVPSEAEVDAAVLVLIRGE